MSNDSARHRETLVDNLWRQSKRKDVYHVLLLRWLKATHNAERCSSCGAILQYGEPHEDDCLRVFTEKALNGDIDELGRILKELIT